MLWSSLQFLLEQLQSWLNSSGNWTEKSIGSSLCALLSNFVIKLHGNRSSKLPLCEGVWKFKTCFRPNQSKPSNIARFYMSEKLPSYLTKIFFRKLPLISTFKGYLYTNLKNQKSKNGLKWMESGLNFEMCKWKVLILW